MSRMSSSLRLTLGLRAGLRWERLFLARERLGAYGQCKKTGLEGHLEGVTSGWEVWLDEERSELFEDWAEFEEFLRAEEDVKENEDEGEDKV